MNDEVAEAPKEDVTYVSRQQLLTELGLRLQRSRKSQKLSHEHVSQQLKLNKSYLEALEEGTWEQMPGEVYAIGFLRQYAAFLELDVTNEISLLKSQDYELTRPLTFPDPPIAPRKSWAIIALLAFVVLFILFNLLTDSDEAKLPDEANTVIEESDNTPVTTDNEAPLQERPAPAVTPDEPVAAEPVTEPASSVPANPEPALHTYILKAANSDAWLQVFQRNDQGETKLLREALLRQGQAVHIETTAEQLELTCGNAHALAIEIDGKTVSEAGSLGKEGQVIHNRILQVPTNTSLD